MCAHLLCYQQIHTFMCTLFNKKSQHVSANYPLRPTTADHPGRHRAPQSGFSFLDSDTTRWQKWNVSRACLSVDGVPGTSRFSCSHGTQVCDHMEPVRTWNTLVCTVCTVCTYGKQCAQKNANCVNCYNSVYTFHQILKTCLSRFWKSALSWKSAGCTHTTHGQVGGPLVWLFGA